MEQPKQYPCFLCGEAMPIKSSKKGKPYLICDPCGLQVFIRKQSGITRFNEIARIALPGANQPVFAQIKQLQVLRQKQQEHEDQKGIIESIFPSEDTKLIEKALGQEITKAQAALAKRK
jgi:DNA-directed RNA polymerase subunit RPC12/RpoP